MTTTMKSTELHHNLSVSDSIFHVHERLVASITFVPAHGSTTVTESIGYYETNQVKYKAGRSEMWEKG